MKLDKINFGNVPLQGEADLYTVENDNGMVLNVTNFGGIIQGILVPDRNGILSDMVLGFDELDGYLGDHPYIGTLVGRFANRIGKACFSLEDTTYPLARNHGNHHLHGGITGFDKVCWEASAYTKKRSSGVILSYLSTHMEEGYPGNLEVKVDISLDEDNNLCLDYQANTDKPTFLNLTHHGYFNLNGGKGTVHDHELQIDADRYVVTDEELIPTGEIRMLKEKALDFRQWKPIGRDLHMIPGGYDHCYVLGEGSHDPQKAAEVFHPGSGRRMQVLTTEPGIQFYSSNFLEGITGKAGQAYSKHQALCLETQHFPDSPNQPDFPSTLLMPGEQYRQKTVYKFTWD